MKASSPMEQQNKPLKQFDSNSQTFYLFCDLFFFLGFLFFENPHEDKWRTHYKKRSKEMYFYPLYLYPQVQIKCP